mgnify:CR=1 FL=1
MEAVAHSPGFAKKVGIPQSVGKEFAAADKGKKFGTGGRAAEQGINKPKTDHGKTALFSKGGIMAKNNGITTAKMGAVKSGGNKKHGEHAVQTKGHTKGKQVTIAGGKPLGMCGGGMAKGKK